MSLSEQHFNQEEIEWLVDGKGNARGKNAPAEFWANALRHLRGCEACRRLVDANREIEESLVHLHEVPQGPLGTGCPPESIWRDVATGTLSGKRVEDLLDHGTQCDHCGPLLRAATEEIGLSVTDDEEAYLAGLETATPDWQRRLAERISRASIPTKNLGASQRTDRHIGLWPRLVFGLAGAAAFIVIVFLAFGRRQPLETAGRLVAEAYTQHRTIELRLSGASYGSLRTQRGGEPSHLDNPQPLLDAEALVAKNLAKNPSDPGWLGAKGRIDLLEGNTEEAIKSLHRACDLDANSTQFKIDLGSAYFERAERADRSIDYGTAVEWFGKALNQAPDDPVALFNRAIAYERIFLYDQAIHDWERYLEMDRQGEWSAEARSRLDNLKAKIKSHGEASVPPIADPSTALMSLTTLLSVRSTSLESTTSMSEEGYLDVAMDSWLPALYIEEVKNQRTKSHLSEQDALRVLGDILSHHHNDNWMNELVRSPSSTRLSQGVQLLVAAVRANKEGNADRAHELGNHAIVDFRAAGSVAGTLRSRFEIVYALKRAQRGPECLRAANGLLSDLKGHSYAWLQIQTRLEQSNCLYMVGDFESARLAAGNALTQSESSHYGTLYLRSLGFLAGLNSNKGDMAAAWRLDSRGLALFWTGGFDPLRAWQFYSDMGFAAEELSEWNLAIALSRESIDSLQRTGRHAEEARARVRLATMLAAGGRPKEASDEFEVAAQLYATLPQAESVIAFEADGEIALAESETNSNQSDLAYSRLSTVRKSLPQLQSYTIPLRYYKTLGRLHSLRGEDDQAESALRAALLIATSGARSFTDGRDRLEWERETDGVYRYLVELLLFHRHSVVDAFRIWEQHGGASLEQVSTRRNTTANHSFGQKTTPIPFTSIESSLSSPKLGTPDASFPKIIQGMTVISYAWLTNGLAIWVFDDGGVHFVWRSLNRESFDRVARQFVEHCSTQESGVTDLRIEGHQLYKWLVAPIESFLQTGKLLAIESDETIGLIPFQALSDDSGRYLWTRWPILYSHGAGRRKAPSSSKRAFEDLHALVVGIQGLGTNFSGTLSPLPDSQLEARGVAERFPTRTLLLGEKATPEALRTALNEAELFHFSGHSIISPGHHGLLLPESKSSQGTDGENGLLFDADEIRKLRLQKCQLVVLSACSTARSEESPFDPEDLVSAFLQAGAHQVVASHWDVDSAATRVFMNALYARMSSGSNLPEALRLTGTTLMNDPKTMHPYFWAAFSAYGAN